MPARAATTGDAGSPAKPSAAKKGASKKAATTAAAPRRAPAPALPLADALLRAYDTNDRVNQYLFEALSDEAWTAEPPGGRGRGISAIAAHMHNVRVMWLKAVKAEPIPAQLERTATRAEAARAFAASRDALARVLAAALTGDGRVKGFRPDAAGFFGYLVAHDAHHRGQITMLARQAGHPISQKAMFGMWEWGSRGAD